MTPEHQQALKRCPLCGKPAHFFEITDVDQRDFGGEGICCETEGCATIGLRFACMEDVKPLLAEQWNRRAGERADVVPLSEEERRSLACLDQLCTPSYYLDRLGPIRNWVIAASQDSKGGK